MIAAGLNSRTRSDRDFIGDADTHHIPIQNNNYDIEHVGEDKARQDLLVSLYD